jgi:hypothetical protein
VALNPLGPTAGAFCLDNHEVAAIMGPVGSAKTTAAANRIARHAYEQWPGPFGMARTRFAIVRNTGPQLHDTTIKSWLKLFPENIYGKFHQTTKTQRWRFVPQGMNKMIDAEFIFRALDDEDDVANLLSLEVTGFWFNELREINTKILAHAGRRAGRYPGADLGGCKWRGWIGDTNPWPFTSDLHGMFVTNKREGYEFFKQPGGMDPDAENLENLEQTPETLKLPYSDPRRREQGRVYYINALRDYSPEDAEMYVHSKYGASRSGKPCYPSYNDNSHCKPCAPDPSAPLKIGYDNTGRNPAALVAQKTRTGQWRALLEYVEQNMGLKQHAQNLKRILTDEFPNYAIEKITCDPAGKAQDAYDQDSRKIIADVFNGVTVLNALTNDLTTRLEAVDGTFRRMVNGEPAILIDPKCKILRSACISEYHFRKMKVAGAERYSDEPNKTHPHGDAAEALQYLLLGGGEGNAATRGSDAPGAGMPQGPIKPPVIWTPFNC